MSKPAGSDGSNLPDSTARPVAGSSEIITRLARDMRNASMFCEGPAVPWMTARDIAEAAVHAAFAAGRAAATPTPSDEEGWSPGIDDPEPRALGDIDTGEGWYQT